MHRARRTLMLLTLLLGTACTSGGGSAADGGQSAVSGSPPPASTSAPLATETNLGAPEALAFDRDGNLYVSEYGSNRVFEVDHSGVISLVAHSGPPGFSGDGGPATAAQLSSPTGLAFDARGRLVIVDHFNARIRRVDADGVIDTIAGTGVEGLAGDHGPALDAEFAEPIGIAFDTPRATSTSETRRTAAFA